MSDNTTKQVQVLGYLPGCQGAPSLVIEPCGLSTCLQCWARTFFETHQHCGDTHENLQLREAQIMTLCGIVGVEAEEELEAVLHRMRRALEDIASGDDTSSVAGAIAIARDALLCTTEKE